jgi:hypothetical protein
MTTLTHCSSLLLAFPTGVQAHRRGIERKSTDGVAHIRVIIVASLAGILFGFDTAVIVGITRALCEISSLSAIATAVSSAR